MAADAPKVDMMTTTVLMAAADSIFLSIFTCLLRPLARPAKHLGRAFGSEATRKFQRKILARVRPDNDRRGVAQVST
jgi:hypothetical protein